MPLIAGLASHPPLQSWSPRLRAETYTGELVGDGARVRVTLRGEHAMVRIFVIVTTVPPCIEAVRVSVLRPVTGRTTSSSPCTESVRVPNNGKLWQSLLAIRARQQRP